MDGEPMPRAVNDISYWPYMVKKGRQIYCLGSKSVDRYLKLDEDSVDIVMEAIGLLDGQHSLQSIEEHLLAQKNTELDMQALYKKLESTGLISDRQASNTASEIAVMGVDVVKFIFPPVPIWLRKTVGILWNAAFGVSFVIFAAAIAGAVLRWDRVLPFMSDVYVYQDSFVLGVLAAMLFSAMNILMHELSHWATAIRFGLQPSEFHMTLYAGIFPMWYVKVRGIYTVPTKQRVAIMAAGMYTNATLLSLAIAIALWWPLPSYDIQLLSKIMISNFYQIVYSLSPLQLSDGYFIMSLLTKVSNPRIRIIKAVKAWFHGQKEKLGHWLILYFIASLIFVAFGVYSTLTWNFNIFYELSADVSITALRYLITAMPFIVLAVTILLFLRGLIKFIKSSEEPAKDVSDGSGGL